MTVTIRQVGPCFAGEVDGIDMRKPLTPDEVAAIHAGMDKYAVLVFHDQKIDDAQQLAFTQSLGEIEHAIGTSLRAANEARLPTTFADVSNLDKNNTPFARDDRRRLFAIGNRLWHSDCSFKTTPAKYSLLHAISIPSKGGDTQFAYMRAAYDALDEETKAEVEDMVCEHSQMFSRQLIGFTDFTDEERERFKPVLQRMVRTLPATGSKSLYLSSHAGGIIGWPMPEARGYLRDLVEHATQREFVYTHKWRVDDLVMWDNRQTMHRARPFPANEPRDMRRTTLAGDGPTVAQAMQAAFVVPPSSRSNASIRCTPTNSRPPEQAGGKPEPGDLTEPHAGAGQDQGPVLAADAGAGARRLVEHLGRKAAVPAAMMLQGNAI